LKVVAKIASNVIDIACSDDNRNYNNYNNNNNNDNDNDAIDNNNDDNNDKDNNCYNKNSDDSNNNDDDNNDKDNNCYNKNSNDSNNNNDENTTIKYNNYIQNIVEIKLSKFETQFPCNIIGDPNKEVPIKEIVEDQSKDKTSNMANILEQQANESWTLLQLLLKHEKNYVKLDLNNNNNKTLISITTTTLANILTFKRYKCLLKSLDRHLVPLLLGDCLKPVIYFFIYSYWICFSFFK
jgi:hypothetical protein